MSKLMDSHPDLPPAELQKILETCLDLRLNDASLRTTNAIRLFNGFYEGFPRLTVDLFGNTLVISDHEREVAPSPEFHQAIAQFYAKTLPEIQSVLLKQRHAQDVKLRQGVLIYGEQVSTSIEESGVKYALNLRLNQDSSFYPDTRNLRRWLSQRMKDTRVLNCFAYTGALGIAALAGGAREVIQTDLNPNFLALAKRSLAMNEFPGTMKNLSQDFYPMVAGYKNQSELFDGVILDAPLFSKTRRGRVDLLQNWHGLINKIRPLIGHEGWLVAINNALFLPGNELIESVKKLTADGYLEISEIVSVPRDVTGYAQSIVAKAPADPAPFNHPTKIIIMRACRKDGRRA
jgi:23S rRNA (cytosine1962-C5)-methyltransferase